MATVSADLLETIPLEVFYYICDFLTVSQLRTLALVNKRLYSATLHLTSGTSEKQFTRIDLQGYCPRCKKNGGVRLLEGIERVLNKNEDKGGKDKEEVLRRVLVAVKGELVYKHDQVYHGNGSSSFGQFIDNSTEPCTQIPESDTQACIPHSSAPVNSYHMDPDSLQTQTLLGYLDLIKDFRILVEVDTVLEPVMIDEDEYFAQQRDSLRIQHVLNEFIRPLRWASARKQYSFAKPDVEASAQIALRGKALGTLLRIFSVNRSPCCAGIFSCLEDYSQRHHISEDEIGCYVMTPEAVFISSLSGPGKCHCGGNGACRLRPFHDETALRVPLNNPDDRPFLYGGSCTVVNRILPTGSDNSQMRSLVEDDFEDDHLSNSAKWREDEFLGMSWYSSTLRPSESDFDILLIPDNPSPSFRPDINIHQHMCFTRLHFEGVALYGVSPRAIIATLTPTSNSALILRNVRLKTPWDSYRDPEGFKNVHCWEEFFMALCAEKFTVGNCELERLISRRRPQFIEEERGLEVYTGKTLKQWERWMVTGADEERYSEDSRVVCVDPDEIYELCSTTS